MSEVEKFGEVLAEELKLDEWTIWEHYEDLDPSQKKDANRPDLDKYKASSQKVAWFNDIISFWQVWNNFKFGDMKKFFINYPTATIQA